MSEGELISAGQRYALDPTHTESLDQECEHSHMSVRPPRKSHPPKPLPEPEPVQEEIEPEEEESIIDENQSESPDEGEGSEQP